MSSFHSNERKRLSGKPVFAALVACSMLMYTPISLAGDGTGTGQKTNDTASPIKHVIIIVGENRSFDHVYATYVPKNKGEKVQNLLSEGIINADGTPGENFAQAYQF